MRLRRAATAGKRLHVRVMLGVMGRALQASSQTDARIQHEVAPLPDGFLLSMRVLGGGPALVVEKTSGTTLRYRGGEPTRKPDLTIAFKHPHHAFLALSFKEDVATAFARNRMVVDGDPRHALRLTRVLARLESLILPRALAERAIKEYPRELGLGHKLVQGTRIYLRLVRDLITVS